MKHTVLACTLLASGLTYAAGAVVPAASANGNAAISNLRVAAQLPALPMLPLLPSTASAANGPNSAFSFVIIRPSPDRMMNPQGATSASKSSSSAASASSSASSNGAAHVPAPLSKTISPAQVIPVVPEPRQSPLSNPSPSPVPLVDMSDYDVHSLGDAQLKVILDHGYENYNQPMRGLLMQEVLPFHPNVALQSERTGCTLAHFAAATADRELAEILKKRWAEACTKPMGVFFGGPHSLFETIKDRNQHTAVDIAVTSKHPQAAQFINWLFANGFQAVQKHQTAKQMVQNKVMDPRQAATMMAELLKNKLLQAAKK